MCAAVSAFMIAIAVAVGDVFIDFFDVHLLLW